MKKWIVVCVLALAGLATAVGARAGFKNYYPSVGIDMTARYARGQSGST